MLNLNPRTQIIQFLINKYNYKSYLEVGVERGDTFLNINCAKMIGVDPDPKSLATIFKTSDEFFKENTETFDIIFIDGLHLFEQAYKDIINSLKVLNKNGTIVVHDTKPVNLFEARLIPQYEEDGTVWTGSTWQAWIKLRTENADLTMNCIDTDYGVGIIQRGHQNLIEFDFNLPYEQQFNNWFANKKILSNIIQPHDFFKKYIYE